MLAIVCIMTSYPSFSRITKPSASSWGISTVFANPRASTQKGSEGSIASTTRMGVSFFIGSDSLRDWQESRESRGASEAFLPAKRLARRDFYIVHRLPGIVKGNGWEAARVQRVENEDRRPVPGGG